MCNYGKEICKLMYGTLDLSNLAKLNFLDFIIGLLKALECRKLYCKYGIIKSINFIENNTRRNKQRNRNIDKYSMVFKMRKMMVLHNNVCKFFKKSSNCLENSISLCCFLSYLGLEPELVIGKTINYVNPEFNFHAWVEYEGITINDTMGVFEMYDSVYKKIFNERR